ncbi:MAG TPA: phosphotransferase [Gaiellales bacterium]
MAGDEATQDQLDRLAAAALASYDLSPSSTVSLINVSENWTFRVDDPETGRRAALRLHRPGYHDAAEIESELTWLEALRDEGVIETPRILRTRSGERVVGVSLDELATTRNVVLFDWVEGAAPTAEDVPSFQRLGAVSARMHQHARTWRRPPSFTRFTWDYETTLGPRGHWGRWQSGLGMTPDALATLGRLDETIRRRLERFGTGSDRFGLTHADLRIANLIVDADRTIVIDFDDCGLAWFMYDWATAVSFMEDHPSVPELQDAWVEGYRGVAPLSADDEAELPTFVMLRRLLLTAWIGSHHTFATEAAELGAGFTEGTCALAEAYLSTVS